MSSQLRGIANWPRHVNSIHCTEKKKAMPPLAGYPSPSAQIQHILGGKAQSSSLWTLFPLFLDGGGLSSACWCVITSAVGNFLLLVCAGRSVIRHKLERPSHLTCGFGRFGNTCSRLQCWCMTDKHIAVPCMSQ